MAKRRIFTTQRLFAIHGWLGLNLGLLLFIVCFSGTIATLSHEIDWLLNPAIRVSPPPPESSRERVSWGIIERNVQQALADGTVIGIADSRGPRWAVDVLIETTAGQLRHVYVNPYTGEVQGHTSYFNVQRFFRSFHYHLFFPEGGVGLVNGWGIYVVTMLSWSLLFSVLSGFLFYASWWRRLFTLRWARGRRILFSDFHRMAGVWTLLFALLIAATGVWYLVEAIAYDAGHSWGAEPPAFTTPQVAANGPAAAPASLDESIAAATHAFPSLRVKQIWMPYDESGILEVQGQADAWLLRDRASKVWVDSRTATVLGIQRGEELGPLDRWVDTADPLHFGDFGGIVTKLLWFLFGLMLSASILVGGYLWHLRAQKSAAARRSRFGSLSSLTLNLTIVLLTAWYGCRGIVEFGPEPGVPPATPWTVQAFIAGFVVVTCVIIAAWLWMIDARCVHQSDRR